MVKPSTSRSIGLTREEHVRWFLVEIMKKIDWETKRAKAAYFLCFLGYFECIDEEVEA